jgi:phenylpropionate dioxygenase-like ring-hydroxylating dioxygenase large terminal subunit
MYLKNVWHVAGWSHEVGPDTILARRLLEERVVLFRDSAGVVQALADRCPHRAAPLSIGRREGDALRCMYHGLLFDGRGRCVEVPGVDEIPPGLDARSYPVAERNNLIWMWMGDPALADRSAIADLDVLSNPDWFYEPGYLHYGSASYLLIMDNLLDFSHLGFVHEATLGGGRSSSEVRAHLERFDWGLRITRKYVDENGVPPFLQSVADFEGPADRWQIYEWRIAGNLLIMDSGVAPAGSGALEGRIPADACVMRSVQALTPDTGTSTHYFFMQAHSFAADPAPFTAQLSRGLHAAFMEDKVMIEAQQHLLLEQPDAPMGAIPADAGLYQGRRILKRMMDAERAAQTAQA